jgi:hypothetical protein
MAVFSRTKSEQEQLIDRGQELCLKQVALPSIPTVSAATSLFVVGIAAFAVFVSRRLSKQILISSLVTFESERFVTG